MNFVSQLSLLVHRLSRKEQQHIRRSMHRLGMTLEELFSSDAAFYSKCSPRALEQAACDIALWQEQGIVTLTRESVWYPRVFLELHEPPFVFFALGNCDLLLQERSVAVVGSRGARPSSCSFARRLGFLGAEQQIVIVSGLALGIDGAAHEGLVNASKHHSVPATGIAVLGAGLDTVYPRQHEWLFRGLLHQGGLCISQYEPGVKPLPHHFLQRNQLIAALGRSVVVVAAAQRSGSLNTVRHALDLGRDVYAVPGDVHDATMAGCNLLIRDGASPLISVEDLACLVPHDPVLCSPSQMVYDKKGGAASRVATEQREGEALVLDFLRIHSSVHIDDLIAALPFCTPKMLLELELTGVVSQEKGIISLQGA